MNGYKAALRAEMLKSSRSSILWGTFLAFALAPMMGGIFIIIADDPEMLAKAGTLKLKMQAMNFSADWHSYFGLLVQAIGVGGILVFGFVASWIFGREYSDGTAKDLLALPVSRTTILNAKFTLYIVWCLALVVSNLLVALVVVAILGISIPGAFLLSEQLPLYFNTTLLTVCLGSPVAFFAIWGKSYLAPLGFVALTLVFAQVVAATGYGFYFPWSVPGLYSGTGGDYALQLNYLSYGILMATSATGYMATVLYWKYSDHKK